MAACTVLPNSPKYIGCRATCCFPICKSGVILWREAIMTKKGCICSFVTWLHEKVAR